MLGVDRGLATMHAELNEFASALINDTDIPEEDAISHAIIMLRSDDAGDACGDAGSGCRIGLCEHFLYRFQGGPNGAARAADSGRPSRSPVDAPARLASTARST
jgi:hypothetical protein